MEKQKISSTLSTEQIDFISKKLKEIPLDAQLNGEFLPMSTSTPINILILESDEKSNQTKAPQAKNSKKNPPTKSSSPKNQSKPTVKTNDSKPAPQKTATKQTPQKKETKPQQNPPPASNTTKESQDPSKGLDDWLDSLLS